SHRNVLACEDEGNLFHGDRAAHDDLGVGGDRGPGPGNRFDGSPSLPFALNAPVSIHGGDRGIFRRPQDGGGCGGRENRGSERTGGAAGGYLLGFGFDRQGFGHQPRDGDGERNGYLDGGFGPEAAGEHSVARPFRYEKTGSDDQQSGRIRLPFQGLVEDVGGFYRYGNVRKGIPQQQGQVPDRGRQGTIRGNENRH